MAKDDAQPATKKEFRELKLEVEGIDARLIRVEGDVSEVKQTVGTILDIVTSLDKKFKGHEDLPERMAEAEDDIVKLKSRAY